jgi:hypothetical protein
MRLSRTLKLAFLLLAVLTLVVVGFMAAFKSINLNQLKELLTNYVQTATGRTCTITGPLELRLGLISRVVANGGVTLANPSGCTRPDMVKIERFEMEIALLPLLKREIFVDRLIISSPDILLETEATGQGNLEFKPTAEKSETKPAATEGGSSYRFILGKINIEKGLVTWLDRTTGHHESVAVNELTLLPDQTIVGPMAIRLSATTRDRRVNVEGTVGRLLDAATSVNLWSLNIKAQTEDLVLTANGVVAELFPLRGVDLKLAFQGAEVADAARLAALKNFDTSTSLGPFKVSARLHDAGGSLNLVNVDAAVGKREAIALNAKGAIKDLRGDVSVDLALTMEGENVTNLSSLVGTDLPFKGPLKISSVLLGRRTSWKLVDFKATMAGNDLSGNLVVENTEHPRLVGKLSANILNINDFIIPAAQTNAKSVAQPEKGHDSGVSIALNKPLPVQVLRAWEVDLALDAGTLVSGTHRLTDVATNLQLNTSKLSFKQFRFGLSGMSVTGNANMDILVEQTAKGSADLDTKHTTERKQSKIAADNRGSANRFTLGKINVDNALVSWQDRTTNRIESVEIHKLTLLPDRAIDGPLSVQLAAATQGHAFKIEGKVGRLDGANVGRPWPLNVKIGLSGLELTANGVIADLPAFRGLNLQLVAQGRELADVARTFQIKKLEKLQSLGPFKVSARLNNAGGALDLIDVDATVGKREVLSLNAKGIVKDLRGVASIDLALSMESTSLANLSPFIGIDMPPKGPVKVSGLLRGKGKSWKMSEITAVLADSDISGDLDIDIAAGRPKLAGKLSANVLHLHDFISTEPNPFMTPPSQPDQQKDNNIRLFSDKPLPVEALRAWDIDLALQADTLVNGDYRLTNTTTELHLNNGQLSLQPFRCDLAGGTIEGEANLDEAGKATVATIRLIGRQIELGKLNQRGLISGGKSDVKIELKGKGQSVRALMASASGETTLSVGEGQIHNKAIHRAAGDLLFQMINTLNPLAKQDDTAQLSCAAARFTIKDGVATADKGLAVRTAKVDVMGSGTVDLRSESLDLAILSRAREGFGLSLSSPLNGFRLGGTFAKPTIGLENQITLRNAATMGAAVATSGLSVLGKLMFDKVSADSDPCGTVLSQTAIEQNGNKQKQGGTNFFQGLLGR